MNFISINIDEAKVLQLFSAEIRKQVQEIENELVYGMPKNYSVERA